MTCRVISKSHYMQTEHLQDFSASVCSSFGDSYWKQLNLHYHTLPWLIGTRMDWEALFS